MNRQMTWIISIATAAALSGCVVESAYPPPQAALEVQVAQVAPPPLPVYEQPPCPEPGYLWTPGYWAWGPMGYYWVPGTWVLPPQVGFLWTPGYWAAGDAGFVFHSGYWGTRVGFYGGVSYGGGYTGSGYAGGRWVNNSFQYNTAVTNVNVTNIHNVYHETVINNVTVNNVTINNVSYSGGTGGARAQPTREELLAERERHLQPTPDQHQHQTAASVNSALFASHNHGLPPIAATPRPGAFAAPGVTAPRPTGTQPGAAHPPAPGNFQQPRQFERAEAPPVYRPPVNQPPPAYRPPAPAYRPPAPAYRPPATQPAANQFEHRINPPRPSAAPPASAPAPGKSATKPRDNKQPQKQSKDERGGNDH